jgi:hypothetical protein
MYKERKNYTETRYKVSALVRNVQNPYVRLSNEYN